MKKATQSAAKRILKAETQPSKSGFFFKDKNTGMFGVTDSFCLVMYDDASADDFTELEIDPNDVKQISAKDLFEPFNDRFHEFYSDDRMENIAVKDIVDMAKNMKKNSKENPFWYQVDNNGMGITYDVRLMRNACDALDTKDVGIYYPYTVYEVYGDKNVNTFKPIVIFAKDNHNKALVMQMRR